MEAVDETARDIIKSLSEGKLLSTDKNTENGISLLDLKNDVALSYVNNLVLVAASQLEDETEILKKTRRRTIEQRITLEKGIKGLESKLSYQLDRVLRAYQRSKENSEVAADNIDIGSDDDVDPTMFRPNVESMKRAEESDEDTGKYRAPRIAPAALPSSQMAPRRSRRRDFAMEEYLEQSADAPSAEPSIGSQIMDHGRGGERTAKDRRRDREVQEYEESNFRRISQPSAKQGRRDAAQRQRDAQSKSLFGEDWGFLDRDEQQKKKRRKHKN